MLADRIQKLSEGKFAELSVQLQGLPNPDNMKKVCNKIQTGSRMLLFLVALAAL